MTLKDIMEIMDKHEAPVVDIWFWNGQVLDYVGGIGRLNHIPEIYFNCIPYCIRQSEDGDSIIIEIKENIKGV